MCIKKRLRKVLDEREISIKEASEICDIPYRTLQNYLLSDREPNAKALTSLRTHLGVSIDWLLTGNGEMWRTVKPKSNELKLDPKEEALLTIFNELGEDDQREICRLAEDKKRQHDMIKQIEELQARFEEFKKVR